MEDLKLTREALDYVIKKGQEQFNGNYALIMADMHSIGSMYEFYVKSMKYAETSLHYELLYPKGYKDYPFPIYVDTQSKNEGYLPDQGVITLNPVKDSPHILIFLNPKFEDI